MRHAGVVGVVRVAPAAKAAVHGEPRGGVAVGHARAVDRDALPRGQLDHKVVIDVHERAACVEEERVDLG